MTTFVYITAAGNNLIRAYEMDGSGCLTLLSDASVDGGPSALASSVNDRFLYCSLRASQELAAFAIEQDGSLRLLGRKPLDADACYVAPDRTGSFLLSAYYSAGKVTVHSLEADGTVGELVCTAATAARAHCIETDQSNCYAFVPHPLEANCLYQFLFDERTGQLTPNPAARTVDAPAGAGPRHFVFSQDQRFVYTSDEDGSSVTAYHFDATSGSLQFFQTISTLPDEFKGANTCAQIHLHPLGHTLYVSNRGHDSLAIFAVDIASGALSRRGLQQTEAVPRVFNIDPSGKFLVAAGQGTGKATSYAVDSASRVLTPLHSYEVGEKPMWVLFRAI
ncbi:MAG: lactonase family protein [Caldilineaceae bacterium]|nr:lactonase family protein [Caldilineaceae bacterium]